ncbi:MULTISPECIES: cytochrome c oxidase accessory protein CcoG [Hyphomicrobium]|jgi:cytochrome c oxidase accessory protein FixG|uniref:cytochrome c oxidase accessory protein CcoG n=1 Tax=Hyphomicrobium TaxID=81 RepID=UPI000366FFAF|nr:MULTISPECIES: cytochrome c oxidase accessory protein CcoG [Hyphomicrobium]WBT40390.1 cytochrome c oxidase accessory protein CcoG [Hyphomicrobium sp. DMF-1]HML42022.1 cytochrome c oxidase accessory protein CcoG [Hyphomicrobium zavarzinii]
MEPVSVSKNGTPAEAAPGIARIDVAAVSSKALRSLYGTRQKIYPKRAKGTFRSIKWLVMAVTLGIYYLLPWFRWDRGPTLPNQAFLLDFANQRLFFGPIEIWAQELYFITGILVISALGLFLVTAIAGRMWCGYACPQTVWTDLMIAVERFWQGDRNARMRLDSAGWTFEKIWKKTATHVTWLLISLATGGVLVFYFRDAPTLAGELIRGDAPIVAYVFLGVFTATTYLLGGIAREQVCIYMCPWPRIQAAMFDAESLLVSYHDHRGEPRGPHKKGQSWLDRGDCIDCKACVAVCPMGIDIRDGAQLECIQCALCIDACDDIMGKVGRPKGLISYDTFLNVEAPAGAERSPVRFVRPRTVLYSVLIALVIGLMGWAWMARSTLQVSVIADRNPIFVTLSDGGVRNGYTVKILNKTHAHQQFRVGVDGLAGAHVSIVGFDGSDTPLTVEADSVRAYKVYVSVPPALRQQLSSSTNLKVSVTNVESGDTVITDTTFRSSGQ